MKAHNQHTVKCLVIHYDTASFLVNQSQFTSSNYYEKLATVKSPSKYLAALMSYNNKNLLTFDLDKMLRESFSCTDDNSMKMALITDVDKLTERSRKLLQKIQFKGKHEISKQAVAFTIAVQSEMREIELTEIKTIPPVIKAKQRKEGILGCRFSADNRVEYLVDIDTIFYNSLKRKK